MKITKKYKGCVIVLENKTGFWEYNTYHNGQNRFGYNTGTEPYEMILSMAKADIDSAIDWGEL